MQALLIEWKSDGTRSGNINPKDPKLQCYGWQNMDVIPMLELRIVEDNRDLSYLNGINGVTILDGQDAINEAIDANFPPKYYLSDEFIYQEHFKQKCKKSETEIDINTLSDNRQERFRVLKDTHGIKGITKKEILHV